MKIKLTQGKHAVIDATDYGLISLYKWHYSKGYAVCSYGSGHRRIWMHRLLNKTPSNRQTDHINGDTLDNRRENLRTVTVKQNQQNQKPQVGRSSKYKGVGWRSSKKRWRAYIKIDGRDKHIGHFDSELDAAKAYDVFAVKEYSEYARPNFKSCLG